MQHSDHLYYCLRRRQGADSSDERGRSRVPRKTVRSSSVAQDGPRFTRYVSEQIHSKRMRCLEKRYLVADYATATYSAGDQAERRFERIIGNSAALESVL